MSTITTNDGVEIFYKDWGSGQPMVFSHGWPLSSDDWDAQVMFFLSEGYRVIAHDRRGHGRSEQVVDGHDMDHYADDLAAVVDHLDLRDASTSATRPAAAKSCTTSRATARTGSRAVLIDAVPPIMVQSDATRRARQRASSTTSRCRTPRGAGVLPRDRGRPVLRVQPEGREPSEAIIENWWRQGMMGGIKAHVDGIVAFSQTDFTEDLKQITIPVLVMHGDDDQIVPYADSGPKSAELLPNGTLKTYPGFPHGCPTTEHATINADLLAWLKS